MKSVDDEKVKKKCETSFWTVAEHKKMIKPSLLRLKK